MKHTYKIGIAGVGVVGGAVKTYFSKKKYPLFLYDKGKRIGSLDNINNADVVFLCVPTPYVPGTGFDLSHIKEVCGGLTRNKIVVIKSTVIPGTTEMLQKEFPGHRFLFNPEFLREKSAVKDMISPDRQIVGYTKKSRPVARTILKLLPRAAYEKVMPALEAELIKYFGNTFLSTKVIFANYMYELCVSLGADYQDVAHGAAADPRIGKSHLTVFHEGYRGYGGKCFPKDMRALIDFAKANNVDFALHELVEKKNEELMRQQHIKASDGFLGKPKKANV
jgi:UDPglucose 6-dehydrogenase